MSSPGGGTLTRTPGTVIPLSRELLRSPGPEGSIPDVKEKTVHGTGLSQGNSAAGNNPKINPMTGEPLDPNHWDYLR